LAVKDATKPIGMNDDGDDVNDSDELFDGFDTLNGIMFAVRGRTPVDVYNYIRIKHPTKGEYEFRLIPKDACNVHRYEYYTEQRLFLLDANAPVRSYSEDSVYGRFTLTFNGYGRSAEGLFDLKEFRTGQLENPVNITEKVYGLLGQGVGGALGGGYTQAYYETILGQLKDPTNIGGGDRALFGETRTRDFSFTSGLIRFNCRMTGTVADHSDDQAFIDRNGTAKAWEQLQVTVLSAIPEQLVTPGGSYTDTRTIGKSWYAYWFGRSGSVTFYYAATETTVTRPPTRDDYHREFEDKAGIKELSAYSEITRSCERGPEHQIMYLNESLDCDPIANYHDLTMVGVKLRTLNQVQSFQQLQIYLKNGISVTRLEDGQYGPSNNFADLVYLAANKGWSRLRAGDQHAVD